MRGGREATRLFASGACVLHGALSGAEAASGAGRLLNGAKVSIQPGRAPQSQVPTTVVQPSSAERDAEIRVFEDAIVQHAAAGVSSYLFLEPLVRQHKERGLPLENRYFRMAKTLIKVCRGEERQN